MQSYQASVRWEYHNQDLLEPPLRVETVHPKLKVHVGPDQMDFQGCFRRVHCNLMTTPGVPSSFNTSSAVSTTSPVQMWEVNRMATLSDLAKSLDRTGLGNPPGPGKSRATLPSNCYFYTTQLLRHYFTSSAAEVVAMTPISSLRQTRYTQISS